jgi:hypothetical protein
VPLWTPDTKPPTWRATAAEATARLGEGVKKGVFHQKCRPHKGIHNVVRYRYARVTPRGTLKHEVVERASR